MKFNNYYFYISLIYFSWIISIFLYFIFDDYVKAGTLVDGVKLGTDSHLQQISQQSQKGAILCYAKNILSLLCAGWGDPKPPSIF